ncbi:2-keto-4-pentenoate hydratase [Microvirga lenta]|uniref:2-keto-4-pentenoate hydratase n=1 Tax=Microvirga lenta TaxID=2881337 RepID=UPI001CFED345|nr:fumarylacetoacetate hydrolase family protein [Microvirga lenta]MCB5174273.1 fumarylacetoacetate hydrolase family protein [Microvirga lenta]
MVHAEAAAAALLKEHDDRTPFHSIRADYSIDDLDDAYEIQASLVRRLRERNNADIAGYKIGLTSPRMQTMCGIPHPIGGSVLRNRVHASGGKAVLSDFVHLGVECEIAVRIGRDLSDGHLPSTVGEMAEAIAGIAPALELVEDRQADYKSLDMLTLVADNSWNAGVVLGEFRESWPDLEAVEGVVERNGEVLDRGHGRDVMGHPFVPLLWLCRHLAKRGNTLRAGDIVMTGSMTPTYFPSSDESIRFSLGSLGAVEYRFKARD